LVAVGWGSIHAGDVVTGGRQELDSATAPTGERALRQGLLLLAKLDFLQDGDKLTVVETT
jgi:hypothetical protein